MKKISGLFVITVLVPTLISAVYYGFVASDVYISESHFIVRSPQRKAPSLLGAALQGAGFSSSQDDTHMVTDYVLSRDALKILDDTLHLKEHYSDKKYDFLSRFNGLGLDDSFEALHRYYQKHIGLGIAGPSSIATLTVRAFTPEDAQKTNIKLLELSEALVNKINERGRQDQIRFASEEVALAEKRSIDAALKLSQYRDNKGVVDPSVQAGIKLEQTSALQTELIKVNGQLAQLRAFAKESPQIPSLKKRVQTLRGAIKSETAKITGGERSLATKTAEYQRLVLQQEFADKQFALALSSLETARNEALRKQLYLERVVQPSLADAPLEPRRLRAVLTTFFISLVAWGVLKLLLAGVREHHD